MIGACARLWGVFSFRAFLCSSEVPTELMDGTTTHRKFLQQMIALCQCVLNCKWRTKWFNVILRSVTSLEEISWSVLFQTSISLCKITYCLQILVLTMILNVSTSCDLRASGLSSTSFVFERICQFALMLLGLKCLYVQGAETPIVIRLDSTGLLEYKDLCSEVRIV